MTYFTQVSINVLDENCRLLVLGIECYPRGYLVGNRYWQSNTTCGPFLGWKILIETVVDQFFPFSVKCKNCKEEEKSFKKKNSATVWYKKVIGIQSLPLYINHEIHLLLWLHENLGFYHKGEDSSLI